MAHFVLGDIHGNYKGLIQALDRSPFDPDSDVLITLGDYIDGGPHIEVMPVIDYLNALPNWIGLLGNHDAMLQQALKANKDNRSVWFEQGGLNTLRSLDPAFNLTEEKFGLPREMLNKLETFLGHLELYYVDECNNAYVHGGWETGSERIENSISFRLHQEDLYWNRAMWKSAEQSSFQKAPYDKVFIGHSYGPRNPEKRHNIWNLDSGGGHAGCITVMHVESEAFWQSDPAPEIYPDFKPRR